MARRAAAGGETVGGRFFKGGQFIGVKYLPQESSSIKQMDKVIEKAAERGAYENIRQAAFSIRKTIRESIKKSSGPSDAGKPVATRGKRGNVKNSIFAAIEKDTAIIGPKYSFVGDSMYFHEFGKKRGRITFPARPTSGPGLTANLDRFAGSFRGSIGG
jgi:phage gpG-like protein